MLSNFGQAPQQPAQQAFGQQTSNNAISQDPTYQMLLQAIQVIHNAASPPQQRMEAQQVCSVMMKNVII